VCPKCQNTINIANINDNRNEAELEIFMEDDIGEPINSQVKSRPTSDRPNHMTQVSISSKSKRSTKTDIMNVLTIEGDFIRRILLTAI